MELAKRISASSAQGERLLAALRDRVSQLGLRAPEIPPFASAKFSLENDLYNGKETLLASFHPSPHYRAGVVLFHSDGSAFAEYHVMQGHPNRPGWFIESVEAWLNGGEVRSDLRLVRMPDGM
ncbi:MAG: hypothetical protein HKL98_03865 [Burkholderiales bacterium]|nr:hypothetical protein [Burkholderiales bacterium]